MSTFTIPKELATECRIVLLDSFHQTILVPREEGEAHLLRLWISRHRRGALQIIHLLSSHWHIHVFIVDIFVSEPSDCICVFAVPIAGDVTDKFRVARVEELAAGELSPAEDALLHMCRSGAATSPLARLNWFECAVAWVEKVTGDEVVLPKGVEQFNAGDGFSLIRFSMRSGETLWLKATGVPNQHERKLTEVLARLAPACLPNYFASKPDWNAWLMSGEGIGYTQLAEEMPELEDILISAVRSLAGLHLATIGQEDALLAAGAFDQRTPVLRAHCLPLFAYVEDAMAAQTSRKVAPLSSGRLRELHLLIMEALDQIENLGLSMAILHGDMNLGNFVFHEKRCLYVDWAEGYVGHPLVSLQHLLLLNPIRDLQRKEKLNQTLRAAYCDAMKPAYSPSHIENGLEYMPLIAAFSALYGRGTWLSESFSGEHHKQAYARCLARYMDAAAHSIESRSRCHA